MLRVRALIILYIITHALLSSRTRSNLGSNEPKGAQGRVFFRKSLDSRGLAGGKRDIVQSLPYRGVEIGPEGIDSDDNRVLGDNIFHLRRLRERNPRPLPAVDIISVALRQPWGLKLAPRNSSFGAYIQRILPDSHAQSFHQLCPGMYLISINGEDCRMKVFTSIIRQVEKIKSEQQAYTTFQFIDGGFVMGGKEVKITLDKPLGIGLALADSKTGKGTKVSALPPEGNALRSARVRIGMRFEHIDHTDVTEATPQEIANYLKHGAKSRTRVTLRFSEPYRVVGKCKTISLSKPLGIALEEDGLSGDVYISDIYNNGSVCQNEFIRRGMVIRGVGEEDVTGRGIHAISKALARPSPFNVTFQLIRNKTSSSIKAQPSLLPSESLTITLQRPFGVTLIPSCYENLTGAVVGEIVGKMEHPGRLVKGSEILSIGDMNIRALTLDNIQKLIKSYPYKTPITLTILPPPQPAPRPRYSAGTTSENPGILVERFLETLRDEIESPKNLQDFLEVVDGLRKLALGTVFTDCIQGLNRNGNDETIFHYLHKIAAHPGLLSDNSKGAHSAISLLFNTYGIVARRGERQSKNKNIKANKDGVEAVMYAGKPLYRRALQAFETAWTTLRELKTDDTFALSRTVRELKILLDALPDYHPAESEITTGKSQLESRVFPSGEVTADKINFFLRRTLLQAVYIVQARYNETSHGFQDHYDALVRHVCFSPDKFSPKYERLLDLFNKKMILAGKKRIEDEENRIEFHSQFEKYEEYWANQGVGKRARPAGKYGWGPRKESGWIAGMVK